MDVSKTQLEMLAKTGAGRVDEPAPGWRLNLQPGSRTGSAECRSQIVARAADRPGGACNSVEPRDIQFSLVSPPGRRERLVLGLVRRPRGASAAEIEAASGWPVETFLTFCAASDLPVVVEEVLDGERRYHVAALIEA
jgi:hypothetical protein